MTSSGMKGSICLFFSMVLVFALGAASNPAWGMTAQDLFAKIKESRNVTEDDLNSAINLMRDHVQSGDFSAAAAERDALKKLYDYSGWTTYVSSHKWLGADRSYLEACIKLYGSEADIGLGKTPDCDLLEEAFRFFRDNKTKYPDQFQRVCQTMTGYASQHPEMKWTKAAWVSGSNVSSELAEAQKVAPGNSVYPWQGKSTSVSAPSESKVTSAPAEEKTVPFNKFDYRTTFVGKNINETNLKILLDTYADDPDALEEIKTLLKVANAEQSMVDSVQSAIDAKSAIEEEEKAAQEPEKVKEVKTTSEEPISVVDSSKTTKTEETGVSSKTSGDPVFEWNKMDTFVGSNVNETNLEKMVSSYASQEDDLERIRAAVEKYNPTLLGKFDDLLSKAKGDDDTEVAANPTKTDEPAKTEPEKTAGSSANPEKVTVESIRNAANFQDALDLFRLDPSEANLEALIGAWIPEGDKELATDLLSRIRDYVRIYQKDSRLMHALLGRCWEVEGIVLGAEKQFNAAGEAFRIAQKEYEAAGDKSKAAVMEKEGDAAYDLARGKTTEEPTSGADKSAASPTDPYEDDDGSSIYDDDDSDDGIFGGDDSTTIAGDDTEGSDRSGADSPTSIGKGGTGTIRIRVTIPGMGIISITTTGAASIQVSVGGGFVRIRINRGVRGETATSPQDEEDIADVPPIPDLPPLPPIEPPPPPTDDERGVVRIDKDGAHGGNAQTQILSNSVTSQFTSGGRTDTPMTGKTVQPQEKSDSGEDVPEAIDVITGGE